MAKGKNRVQILGMQADVMNPYSDLGFLYVASTTKDTLYNIGDRTVTGDGRVFRYCKAANTVQPEIGAGYTLKTIVNAVAPAQATGAGAIGSNTVTLTKDSGSGTAGDGVIAADEMRGGYIVIGNGTSQHPQMRGILGNPASVSGAASLTVTIDAPLTTAVTVGTTNIETILNPYAYITGNTSNAFIWFLGIRAVTATVGQYFWLQTWGACWVTSDNDTCDEASDREIFFVANGSVVSGAAITYAGAAYQRAGFALDASSLNASNAPMIMLQISI
jgi:hypothetical protein